MATTRQLTWQNPREKIWGFHVHQELPLQDFRKALVIQHHVADYLQSQQIPIDASDAVKPGYGPHLDYMWELRVESAKENILEKMGLAIAYMTINRFDLSGYIHPLMQNPLAPVLESLAVEGLDNQTNTTWFSYSVPQHQDFFFHPPLNLDGTVTDTRTSRIISQNEKTALLESGKQELQNQSFRDPAQVITNGFHIHMDFSEEKNEVAMAVFDHFLLYLTSENLRPTSTRIYQPKENGPHVLGGWEVKFETNDPIILSRIGIAIGWLMCNRQGLSVFMHPVTWQEGDFREELNAHKDYAFFIGELPALDLNFFSKKIPGYDAEDRKVMTRTALENATAPTTSKSARSQLGFFLGYKQERAANYRSLGVGI